MPCIAGRVLELAFATSVIVLVAGPSLAQGDRTSATGQWRQFSADLQGTKYSLLDQVTKENADQLRVVWRWPSPDRDIEPLNPLWRASKYQDTPLVIDGVMYTVTTLGLIAALDPGTGQTLWTHDPESYKGFDTRPANGSFSHRGMSYWSDDAARRLFIGTVDAHLLSIDIDTGQPDPAFGNRGKVDLAAGVRQARRGTNFVARRPVVAGDVVIVGTAQADRVRQTGAAPPGRVQAFDTRSGERRWTFHLVPTGDEFGYDTWHNGSAEYGGNTNVWAGITYDPRLGYVYLASSTPSSDYYGGHRPGNNLFAESVICLDAATGSRIWHFQAIHHGLWDYDLPAEPVLGEITVDGRTVRAVMVVSKQGFTYYVRPRDRRARVADRGASGAARRRSWRMVFPNPAVSDQAARIRPPGGCRGQSHRFHSRLEAPSPGAAPNPQAWSTVHSPVIGRDRFPSGRMGRGEMGRRRLRSRNRLAVRALCHDAIGRTVAVRRPRAD